jgi:ribosomal protein L37AE/L43A
MMTLLVGIGAAVAVGVGVRRYTTPVCPRCRRRDWDRRLCAPLLLCRHCSTRVDSRGRVYN